MSSLQRRKKKSCQYKSIITQTWAKKKNMKSFHFFCFFFFHSLPKPDPYNSFSSWRAKLVSVVGTPRRGGLCVLVNKLMPPCHGQYQLHLVHFFKEEREDTTITSVYLFGAAASFSSFVESLWTKWRKESSSFWWKKSTCLCQWQPSRSLSSTYYRVRLINRNWSTKGRT